MSNAQIATETAVELAEAVVERIARRVRVRERARKLAVIRTGHKSGMPISAGKAAIAELVK